MTESQPRHPTTEDFTKTRYFRDLGTQHGGGDEKGNGSCSLDLFNHILPNITHFTDPESYMLMMKYKELHTFPNKAPTLMQSTLTE